MNQKQVVKNVLDDFFNVIDDIKEDESYSDNFVGMTLDDADTNGGATLNLSIANGFTPGAGEFFVII